MQNLIMSMPKEEARQFGVNLVALENMVEEITERTRIVYSVYDNGYEYEIKSECPYEVAAYALAMTCMKTLVDIFEEEERFNAIVRQN